jgi:glycosyltransferase involved in cell wall biosynthesis
MHLRDVRVAIAFKNFASWTGISHVGLNVAAITNARVLRQHRIHVAVFPVRHNIDLVNEIASYEREHQKPLTHVVISAPWLSSWDLVKLLEKYPNIQFAVESHSNVGFLQADPCGVSNIRHYLRLAKRYSNLKVAGNTARFTEWVEEVYREKIVLLPNLYPISNHRPVRNKVHGALKIGLFGAVRPQKNFMTAAAAALAMSRYFVFTELHMSDGGEGDGGYVSRAINEMCKDVPGFQLIRHQWRPWENFIELIAKMDLLLQPSYTESFNMITADGISVGVPSVVSTAITWAPESWKADSDNALDIADVGLGLLGKNADEGFKALHKHNAYALPLWFEYLTGHKQSLFERLKRLF